MNKNLSKLKMPAMLLFSGILSAVPLLFPQLGFFQWLSLIPMAIVLIGLVREEELKLFKAYLFGIIFYMGYFPVIYHSFLYMYPLDFAGVSNEISLVIVILACFGIAFFQSIFASLGFVAFVAAARTKLVKRIPYLMPIIMAAIWVIVEFWQTIGWWSQPWGKLAIGQVTFSMLVRSASLFGPYFISFVIVAFNFFLALAILKIGVRRIVIAVPMAMFALNLALGVVVTLSYKESDRTVKVAAAQGNISSTEKWDGGYSGILDVYRKLTEDAAADGAEMILWPETALPYDLEKREDIAEKVREIAVENNITILISAFTEDKESGMQYNSLYEINSKGEFGKDVYNKQKLVPFGEFVPMRDLFVTIFPPLAEINMLQSDLKEGEESVVLEGEHGNIGCGICFDAVYETVTLGAVNNGAEIMAFSSNYSWFKDSRALNMHTAHSQLRAIESGRYVICSGNTGISAIIDPLGNVIEETGILERDYVIAEAQLRNDVTLYSIIGNAVVYLCIGSVIAVFAAEIIVRVKDKESTNPLKRD